MPKKASDFYYAVRIGKKPGIYKGWLGEYGAEVQRTGVSKYNDREGYLKTASWEEADEYLRTHDLFVVTDDFYVRTAVPYNEEMSHVKEETSINAAKQEPANRSEQTEQSAVDYAIITPSAPSVPYRPEVNLERFLREFFPDRRFTDDQKAAIQAFRGAHLLYAVPGSGKTTVLTARAGYMIYQGIPAESILIMTFGKKAAEHMEDVFKERFPAFSVPTFCTIHSVCFRVIREAEAKGLLAKHTLICDEEDDPVPDAMDADARESWIVDESADDGVSVTANREDKGKKNRYASMRNPVRLLETILAELGFCKKQSDARNAAEQAATIIGCIKNRMMTEEEIQQLQPMDLGADIPVDIWPVYSKYKSTLSQHRPPEMDFDDMLLYALEALQDPEILASWQQKYPIICIDEAQDTSLLQHAIAQKLHRSGDSLFMVGDDDQSIYAFRGATPQAMLSFEQRYTDAFIHRMGVNFRSDQKIVHSGDQLIRRNIIGRADKPMEADSCRPGDIRIIDISAAAQGRYLLDQAFAFCKDQKGKNDPDSLAILYRNNVSALMPLAYFFKHDIPFESNKVFDILSILYSRTAINILAFLQFILNPNEFASYSRAYPAWNCYHGLFLSRETAVKKLKEQNDIEGKDKPVLLRLKELLSSLGEANKSRHIGDIYEILERLKKEDCPSAAIMTLLTELEYNKNRSLKQSNVQLLVMALIQIASLYDSISAFLDAMKALRAKRKWDEHNQGKHAVVTLSTMHSAKGQEYDHVIIIDATESVMPGDPNKTLPFWHSTWQAHVEEERRLFYVAATRAMHDLKIIVNGLHSTGPKAPCRFIHEMLCDDPDIPVENLSAYNVNDQLNDQIETALGISYLAVRVGKAPGIYKDYNEAGVKGFPGAVFRKFDTWRQANRFLNKAVPCQIPKIMPAQDLPAAVEQALLGTFSVQQLRDLDTKDLSAISQKTDWMFSKEASSANMVDYAPCTREYALLYLPVNMHKIWQSLNALLPDDRLPVLDEYKYTDGAHPIRILEMGAGPGTTTLGVLSFYAMLAEANPSLKIVLEYVTVEREKAFQQIFDMLTGALLKTLPDNLQVKLKPTQFRDAFDFIHNYPKSSFDLVLESNMLNHNERVGVHQLGNFLNDLNRVLVYSGKFIAIEPADAQTAAFLNEVAGKLADHSGFTVMGPKIAANDVSGIRLYRDACECHLRHTLEKDQHLFRYAVLTKALEVTS